MITSSKDRMAMCEWWPDKKPQNDWTGSEYGKLTYLQPIYRQRRGNGISEWMYLTQCACGKEFITMARKQTKSCGCARIDAIATAKLMPKAAPANRKGFNRGKTCINGNYVCEHYTECQDHRMSGKSLSSGRFRKSGCYQPTAAEIKNNQF